MPLIKSIFITGASSGLGRGLVEYYLVQGHRVGAFARSLEKLPQDLKQDPMLSLYSGNIKERDVVKQAIADFAKKGLDIVIANAGISYEHKKDLPDFDHGINVVETNLLGTMHTFEGAIENMLAKKSGQLVAIASISGVRGFPGVSCYSASKSAVMKLCETYTVDLEKYGIYTTCICPGFIDTPLTRKNHHPMPFMLSTADAVKKVVQAIEKRKTRVYFPWLFTSIIRLLGLFPTWLYRMVMKMEFLKFTKKAGLIFLLSSSFHSTAEQKEISISKESLFKYFSETCKATAQFEVIQEGQNTAIAYNHETKKVERKTSNQYIHGVYHFKEKKVDWKTSNFPVFGVYNFSSGAVEWKFAGAGSWVYGVYNFNTKSVEWQFKNSHPVGAYDWEAQEVKWSYSVAHGAAEYDYVQKKIVKKFTNIGNVASTLVCSN